MLQKIRAGTVTGILLGFGFTLWLTGTGRSHLFFPSNVRSETLSAAQYLLSSIVECLGSIFAVSIAVVFITAQVSGRSYARTVAEIYRDRTTFVVVSFFFASISLGIVCLARISSIVDTDRYWMIDVDIWLSLASLLFLFPLILAQVENVNPIHLAAKLASHIVTRNINKYGLSSVEIANTGEATYRLRMQEPFHPSGDPLGAFHEVVMGAVASRDRVSLSLQMRMLLKRIAVCAAVPYGMRLRSNPEGRFWQNMDQAYVFLHEPVRLTDQLSMTLHVLHYYIRRAANLRKEWGDLDAVRQQFVFNLEELIRSLNLRKGTDQLIEICFYATMHLSLSYADLPRYGRTEAFLSCLPCGICR